MDTREVGDSIQARGTEWDGRERVLLLTIGGGAASFAMLFMGFENIKVLGVG